MMNIENPKFECLFLSIIRVFIPERVKEHQEQADWLGPPTLSPEKISLSRKGS